MPGRIPFEAFGRAKVYSGAAMSRVVTDGTCFHGTKGAIGATALQLTAVSRKLNRGVVVKAAIDNTAGSKVYVGLLGVTAGVAAPTTDGFELAPGDAVAIPIDDPSKLYVIGSTTGLAVSWIGN